jgi:flagellar basal body P-ring formation protein FlgA
MIRISEKAVTPRRFTIWVPAFAGISGIRRGLLSLTALLALASPALAGTAVDLRADALGHGGVVTLGDLFDGAEGQAAAKVVGRAPVGQQAVLDAGDVQLAARAAGLDWANSSGQRRIIVSVVDAPASPAAAHHARRHGRAAQVLVYARNIQVGEILQPSDLQWSDEAVAGPDAPRDPDAVVGMAARMPLREGAAIAARDLIAAKVIRRDQMISVDYAADGVSLSLSAKAMGDAAVGDTIQVMNLSSKKIIEAVATGPGHAAVGPTADAARSTNPFRTAALR